jgi:HrpA-like RNA helicase
MSAASTATSPLAMLREIRETVRDDLILIVMSATLDAEPVSKFLKAPIINVPGRTFPIEISHRASNDYVEHQVLDAFRGRGHFQ